MGVLGDQIDLIISTWREVMALSFMKEGNRKNIRLFLNTDVIELYSVIQNVW